jgi:hypothetical protein
MGAPAWGWSRWGPRAGTEQLRNIDAFADAYLEISDPRCLGLILTNWHPSRYIQNSIWDGFAYAAVAFTGGSVQARTSAFRRFVEEYWGAQWNDIWEKVFQIFYDMAPGRRVETPSSWNVPILPVPWSSEGELAAALNADTSNASQFTKLRSLLILCEPLVRRNLDDFQAFQLSVKYLERLFWRNIAPVEEATKKSFTKESSTRLISIIAVQDRQLLAELDQAWDEGRPPDSVAKLGHVYGYRPEDQLLFQFRNAAAFSARLAEEPDRFYKLLTSASSADSAGRNSNLDPREQ